MGVGVGGGVGVGRDVGVAVTLHTQVMCIFGRFYANLCKHILTTAILTRVRPIHIDCFFPCVQVNPDTVIEVWKTGKPDSRAAVTKAGLQAIYSACWYLNIIQYGPDWLAVGFHRTHESCSCHESC